MTIYDYDLHPLGQSAFSKIMRDARSGDRYDPTDSSLTRQAWAYQQKLIDMMGEGIGDADPMALAPKADATDDYMPPALLARLGQIGIDKSVVTTCGVGFVAAAVAGYATGKVGLLPTAAGVGLAYLIFNGLGRKQ